MVEILAIGGGGVVIALVMMWVAYEVSRNKEFLRRLNDR